MFYLIIMELMHYGNMHDLRLIRRVGDDVTNTKGQTTTLPEALATSDIRLALRDLVRPHLVSEGDRRAAAEATGLSFNTVNSMLYSPSRGGIRAWQLLVMHVHAISAERWIELVSHVRRALATQLKVTAGQKKWGELGDQLSERDLHYYAEVVRALMAIREKGS
ncbi:MAG: hypothetical protein AAFX94_03990 [Myxococcota bacterium]